MNSYESAKEWRLYIKFETNHTIWTNTKPLTGIFFFSVPFFWRINEALFINDTKLETTSCFKAEKIALDELLFGTGSLWEAF